MKIVLLLIAFASYALSSAVYTHTAGQPICTESNANMIYRNNWDPTRYWVCTSTRTRSLAAAVLCPDQTGFVDSIKACVSWDKWVWEQPYDPPTV